MAGFIDLIIPKERKFFEHLEEEVHILEESVRLLNAIAKTKRIKQDLLETHVKKIRRQSDNADANVREIITFLHQTFITPIDREEIKTLATKIAYVIDAVEQFASSLSYFKIKTLDSHSRKQLVIIYDSTQILVSIFKESIVKRNNNQKITQIKELENKADDIFMHAVAALFTNNHNAVAILKQKELYSIAEDVIDGIAIVADLLETILINNT